MYGAAGESLPTADITTAPAQPTASPAASPTPETPAPTATPSATTDTFAVPRSELLVVSTLPAYIQNVPGVGATIGGDSSITLSHGSLIASASVASNVAAQIRTGMQASIQNSAGAKYSGKVGAVAATQGSSAQASVTITVATQLPASWSSKQVLAYIVIRHAAPQSLLVPTTAVVTGGNGTSYVLKETSTGIFDKTPVEETGTLAGQSAVMPRSEGSLKVGDKVAVK